MTEATTKKLYLVHVGYYDKEMSFGVYEAHTNFLVAATSRQEAKKIIEAKPLNAAKQLHIDGMQEIEAVDGHRLTLHIDTTLKNESLIHNYGYDQVNAKAPLGNISA